MKIKPKLYRFLSYTHSLHYSTTQLTFPNASSEERAETLSFPDFSLRPNVRPLPLKVCMRESLITLCSSLYTLVNLADVAKTHKNGPRGPREDRGARAEKSQKV